MSRRPSRPCATCSRSPPPAARRPSSPPPTATPSALSARCATATARSPSSASTTSSSPTCCPSPSPWCATTRPRWDASPPRWPTCVSTATTGRPSGGRSRAPSSPVDRGSCQHRDTGSDQAAAQPDPPLLPRRPGDRRAARDRRRRRPLARGVDRLGDDPLRRARARAEPPARRGPRPRRAGLRSRGMARGRPRRALRRAPPPPVAARPRPGAPLPVHHHPDHPFAHEHLGLDFGKTEAWIVLAARDGAEVAVGWREAIPDDTLRAWVDAQDHDALLGALNPVPVSAGDAVFVPAGVPHAIGDGILIAALQEPTDLSILIEWDGFGIDDEQAATLGLGWDVALASVERAARDPSALRGVGGDGISGAVSELLPAAAAAFFTAQRIAPAGGPVQLPAGFAVVLVVDGAGTLAGLDVTRGDALLVPHAAGPVDVDGDFVVIACRPPAVPS